MTEKTELVRYRNVFGVLGEIELTQGSEFVSPGSVLEQRLVTANRQLFVRKFVSRFAGAQNPRLYDLLDNEVRAGTRLGQVFSHGYPPELACLVAYNMDAEEPFALLRGYLGEPAGGAANRFDNSQRRIFQLGLLRALQLTAAAGVVHGAVTLDAVRWDGRQLQLIDFESAERAGEPRRGGSAPARSPEQVAGSGEVDVRDDMWAAGLLIRRLDLGGMMNGARPDRSGDPERLRALLDPVFEKPVDQRPYPADLLRKMRGDGGVPAVADPDAMLTQGRQLFEQVCASKRGPDAVEPTNSRTPRGSRRTRRTLPFLATTMLVTTLIVGLAVLV